MRSDVCMLLAVSHSIYSLALFHYRSHFISLNLSLFCSISLSLSVLLNLPLSVFLNLPLNHTLCAYGFQCFHLLFRSLFIVRFLLFTSSRLHKKTKLVHRLAQTHTDSQVSACISAEFDCLYSEFVRPISDFLNV